MKLRVTKQAKRKLKVLAIYGPIIFSIIWGIGNIPIPEALAEDVIEEPMVSDMIEEPTVFIVEETVEPTTVEPTTVETTIVETTAEATTETTTEVVDEEQNSGGIHMNCMITAYCPCYECSEGYGRSTAIGNYAQSGHTIAVDPSVIPLGTHVYFNGNEYVAEDVGGAVKGNHIDLFVDTHEETLQWGTRYLDVVVEK